jgi:P27 family predicted phage terminase small subunit
MAGTRASGGRNRKPSALHVLQGTFKPGRHARPDVEVPEGTPQCPAHLTGVAKVTWDRIVALLAAQGTLATVDGDAIVNYAQMVALVERLETALAALPSIVFTKTSVDGAGVEHSEPKVHPLVAQVRQARAAMRMHLVELGLTPVSRLRVQPTAKAPARPAGRPDKKRRYLDALA